jgi:hypothetical protein
VTVPNLGEDPDLFLVAAQRPSPAQVAEAAHLLGWLPDVPYLMPAVPCRPDLP